MSRSSRYLAFVSYLLGPLGAIVVLLWRRDDRFASFHARQSLALALAALLTPLIWAVVAWILAWIPVIGPMLGVILFALVLAAYAALGLCWIIGMLYGLRGRAETIPLVGRRAARRQPTPPAILPETLATTVERTTSDAEYHLDRSG